MGHRVIGGKAAVEVGKDLKGVIVSGFAHIDFKQDLLGVEIGAVEAFEDGVRDGAGLRVLVVHHKQLGVENAVLHAGRVVLDGVVDKAKDHVLFILPRLAAVFKEAAVGEADAQRGPLEWVLRLVYQVAERGDVV